MSRNSFGDSERWDVSKIQLKKDSLILILTKKPFYNSFQLGSDTVPEDWYFHHTDPRFCGGAHQCLYLGAVIKRNERKEDSKAKNKNIDKSKSLSQRFTNLTPIRS